MCYERRMEAVTTESEEAEPDTPGRRRAAGWPEAWSRVPDATRRHLRIAATVVAALAGSWLALAVAGTTHVFVGPLAVDASVRPAFTGESVVEIDPIGTLVLDTHQAPVTFHVAVRSVDVQGVRDIVDDPASLATLDEQIAEDVEDVLIRAAVRAAAVAVIGALIAVAVVMRTVRAAVIGLATAVVAVVATYGLAALTYNPQAVREPRFTGVLQTAPQVVGSVENITSNFDAYAEQLASIVTNVSSLYDTTMSLPAFQANDDTIRLLHVSDLHLNPAAWDVIDAVAEQYDVDVIVDAGDIADHGTPIENAYLQPISDLDRPYVYVKGNHDSVATAAAVAANDNAVVLDGEPVEVAGLTFIGAPDPRFTPDQSTRGTADQDILEGTEELVDLATDLDEPADVIVYHDPTHAELFDGAAPLVLSGHAHRRSNDVLDDDTRIMVQGSTGGAGLRALEKEEPTPVMLSVLYFDPETRRMVAWDEVTLGGLGLTSAQIERHQADDEPEPEETPEETLDGTPQGSPDGTSPPSAQTPTATP